MTAKRKKAGMDAEAVARMMAAQDETDSVAATLPPPVESTAPASPPAPVRTFPSSFDPGKVDGRTLRRTGRGPFATRIKPETHEALKRIAYARGITIAEAVELAVAELDKQYV
ncbi:hypothetical protein [uncultured Methylobacterium sp.]|jgi:hypothetical protein|uniref:hypothetical protein n=1 Tax=uncultured Methylobacterium sp. TaxID=157278 RepID=UPI00260A6CE8|nr:hypothetical protein [uncultured Methylobacterium sp.]